MWEQPAEIRIEDIRQAMGDDFADEFLKMCREYGVAGKPKQTAKVAPQPHAEMTFERGLFWACVCGLFVGVAVVGIIFLAAVL